MAFKDEIVIRKYEDTNIMTIPEHIEYISQTFNCISFRAYPHCKGNFIQFDLITFVYIHISHTIMTYSLYFLWSVSVRLHHPTVGQESP